MESAVRPALLPLVCLCVLALGCGSDTRDQSLAISPAPSIVKVGEKLSLSAQALTDLGGEPQWEVYELSGGALLKSQGLNVTYVAPSQVGNYHLHLKGKRADGTPYKQIHEVQVLPTVQVEPATPTVRAGATLQLHAKVRGLAKAELRWEVEEEGGGTISPTGLYHAPTRPGTYHVYASVKEFWGAVGSVTLRVE